MMNARSARRPPASGPQSSVPGPYSTSHGAASAPSVERDSNGWAVNFRLLRASPSRWTNHSVNAWSTRWASTVPMFSGSVPSRATRWARPASAAVHHSSCGSGRTAMTNGVGAPGVARIVSNSRSPVFGPASLSSGHMPGRSLSRRWSTSTLNHASVVGSSPAWRMSAAAAYGSIVRVSAGRPPVPWTVASMRTSAANDASMSATSAVSASCARRAAPCAGGRARRPTVRVRSNAAANAAASVGVGGDHPQLGRQPRRAPRPCRRRRAGRRARARSARARTPSTVNGALGSASAASAAGSVSATSQPARSAIARITAVRRSPASSPLGSTAPSGSQRLIRSSSGIHS